MAWEEIIPAKAGTKASVPARVGMMAIRGGDPKLFILLRGPLLELLPGKGERFKVDLGTVEHRHLVRIGRVEQGAFGALKMGRAAADGQWTYRISLPFNERFPLCSIPAQEVTFEHDKVGKCLLVTLPSWAWDDRQKREVEARASKPLDRAA